MLIRLNGSIRLNSLNVKNTFRLNSLNVKFRLN